jgi:hypothetical protein
MNLKEVEVIEIETSFSGKASTTCITLRDKKFLGTSISTKYDVSMLKRGMPLMMLMDAEESRGLALYSKELNIWIETNYNSEKEILPNITYLLMLVPFGTLLLVENFITLFIKKSERRDFFKSTNKHLAHFILFLSFSALIGSGLLTYNVVVNNEINWNHYVVVSLMGIISLFLHTKIWKHRVGSLVRYAKIKLDLN